MPRILLFLFLFILPFNSLYAQSAPLVKTNSGEISLSKTAADSKSTVETLNQTLTKNNLPSEQKTTPEIFYIVNDKPVSREEYLKHNSKKQ